MEVVLLHLADRVISLLPQSPYPHVGGLDLAVGLVADLRELLPEARKLLLEALPELALAPGLLRGTALRVPPSASREALSLLASKLLLQRLQLPGLLRGLLLEAPHLVRILSSLVPRRLRTLQVLGCAHHDVLLLGSQKRAPPSDAVFPWDVCRPEDLPRGAQVVVLAKGDAGLRLKQLTWRIVQRLLECLAGFLRAVEQADGGE
mmetsp:Transcript_55593/g.159917  ORF Transcript_55593/g.159917 Transcript_55593/m.159917 type:complete len:205 (+) Transcript_55593:189-803(+)